MDCDFTFAWNQLTVSCPVVKSKKLNDQNKPYILQEISGYVESKSLVAIMGPSGAGKTTFLAAVSGRLKKDVKGTIKVNNRVVKSSEILKLSGYVAQDDIFEEFLTVKEHLKFTGALKRVRPELLDDTINNLLFELNLERCQNSALRFLSGGERRRVSLATELITNPRILFCDEPTSGLDSFNASTLMQQLKQRTDCGLLAMVTIHQPSSQVFDYFSHIVLLSEGSLVFNGSKEDMKAFFESMNLLCPISYNPSEFYIKCVTVLPNDRFESYKRVNMLSEAFSKRTKKAQLSVANGLPNGTTVNNHMRRKCRCDLFLQIKWLIWRSAIATGRSFRNKIIHIVLHMLAAVLIGVCYASSSVNDKYRFQNVSGAIVIIITQLLFTEMYAVIGVFPTEYALYLREKALYSHFSYFISSVLVVLPRIIVCNFLFPLVVHVFFPWIASISQYFQLCSIFAISSLAMSTLGFSLSTVIPRIEYLQIVLVPFETVCMTLMGGWINVESIPRYFMWIKYVSPFYYSYEAISITVWSESEDVTCSSNTTNFCITGKDFLQSLGLHTNRLYILNDMSYLVLYVITCSVIGFMALSRTR